MNGNTPGWSGNTDETVVIPKPSAEPADQLAWDRFYRADDLTLLMKVANVPYISGPLGVGPVDSTVVLDPGATGRLYAIPEGHELEIGYTVPEPKYVPIDARPKSQQRANKKLYSKARAYYGKTYIVTRSQLWLAVMVALGFILSLSGLLTLWALHVLGLGQYI